MKQAELNKTAAKAGLWYTIGNIILKGCVFFTLPIFTRILSTTDFGIYNTYIAYEVIVSGILGLGLYSTVKNAKLDFKEKFNEYISSIIFMSFIFFMIILFGANLTYKYYADILGFSKTILNIMLFQSFSSYILYLYAAKLNIEFKYKSYLLITFVNTILNILLSIGLILYVFPNERYLGRILGTAIPYILIGLIIVLYCTMKGKTFYNKNYWKYGLAIGFPLIPHVISQSLLSQFDRVMIRDIVGPSESGIYSYIYTISTILMVISQSFDNAWTSWVYMKLNDGKIAEIKKKSKEYIKLFTILTLGFISVIPEVSKIISSNKYWEGIGLIVPLTLGIYFIFLYSLPVGVEYYHKNTKMISVGTVAATILNVILNYIYIEKYGYGAAAYTTFFSYFMLFIFHILLTKKYDINNIYDIKYIIKEIMIVILYSTVIILFGIENKYIIVLRYIIAILLTVSLIKDRNKYLSIIKKDNTNETTEEEIENIGIIE